MRQLFLCLFYSKRGLQMESFSLHKIHIDSITITYLNTILVNIEVIEMDCLFVFLESFFNTVDEDE